MQAIDRPFSNPTRHREIVAIDIDHDVGLPGVQIQAGGIMKAPDLATDQKRATNIVRITRSPFQPIPNVDRTQLVFIDHAMFRMATAIRRSCSCVPSSTFRYKLAP
jgi:hypothetical protein